MKQYPRAVYVYMWTTSAAGLAILVACAFMVANLFSQSHDRSQLVTLLAFSLLVFIAELVPTKLPGMRWDVEMTMTMPLAVNMFLTQGLASTVVFTSVPFMIAFVIMQRKLEFQRLIRAAAFNTANFIISLGLASAVYLLVGGRTLSSADPSLTITGVILPLLAWTAVYNLVNTVFLSIIPALCKIEVWRIMFLNSLRWCVPNLIFSVPISVMFAALYLRYGAPGVLLLILPCLAGRHASNVTAQAMDAYRDTITTLGTYMQHYHPYTKGHLERVAELSQKVANEMRLPLQSLMFIHDAGLLHDIGKVGVNEEILDKTTKLTDEEWAIIKQHPARGAEILSQMKYLESMVSWVRGHHERPDGRGYPDGLRDGEIPLEAAVIAVADAFDAMTGGPDEKDQRVYRVPLTLDQAMDQVRYGAGTQFDPRVVKAFMRVMAREEEEGER